MSEHLQRLQEILSQDGWRRFVGKMLEYRRRGRLFPNAITLQQPTDDERRHYARLMRLSKPMSGMSLRYDLVRISEVFASSGLESDWQTILEILHGTLPEEHHLALAEKEAWKGLWVLVEAELKSEPFDQYQEWLWSLRRDGTLKRLSKGNCRLAQDLVAKAAKLLRSLPFRVEQSLANVSAQFCGGSHALDATTPLSTLVLRGLALRLQLPTPSRSDSRRELWTAFGVVCDELSAPVLVFNLALSGDALLSRLTSSAAKENQPLHLTTRLIWTTDWSSALCPPEVYVCENPTVISIAAAQFGIRCPPLVCVNGEPATAARSLLRQLRAGGARLHYHGDFDWAGIAIARRVIEELGAIPWSFDVDAYLAASRYQGRELTEKPAPTPWCPNLSTEMQRRGTAYDEEVMAVDLLESVCSQ